MNHSILSVLLQTRTERLHFPTSSSLPTKPVQRRGIRLSSQPPDLHDNGALVQAVVWVAYSDSVGPSEATLHEQKRQSLSKASLGTERRMEASVLGFPHPLCSSLSVPVTLLLWSEVGWICLSPSSSEGLRDLDKFLCPLSLSFSTSLNRGAHVHHVK